MPTGEIYQNLMINGNPEDVQRFKKLGLKLGIRHKDLLKLLLNLYDEVEEQKKGDNKED